jgi:hypothetical protein
VAAPPPAEKVPLALSIDESCPAEADAVPCPAITAPALITSSKVPKSVVCLASLLVSAPTLAETLTSLFRDTGTNAPCALAHARKAIPPTPIHQFLMMKPSNGA